MTPLVITAVLSLLTLASAPAASPTITVAPVTVHAPGAPVGMLKQTRRFVQAYAAPSPTIGQLARWQGPVCVSVFGLAPEQGEVVKARIEDVARAVGLNIERPGCKASIQVVVTGRPQGLLDWVAAHSNWVLGYHYPAQEGALKTISRPVQAWYMTSTIGGASDNGALAFAPVECLKGCGSVFGSAGLPGANTPFETLDAPRNGTPNGCGGHHFTSCLSSQFKNVLVAVDARRVQGQPLGPLADYLAMLALSQPRSLDGCTDLASVIDLYASMPCPGRSAPDGLTPADASYLTALYATDPQAKQVGQEFEIAERMAQILVNANRQPEGRP